MSRGAAPLLALALVVFGPPPRARADEPGPGLHGRFAGDVWLTVGLVGGARLEDGEAEGVAELELRARYLDAAGLVVAPSLLLGDPRARVFLGLEVRPLFPTRFLFDLSSGDPWLDLFVDSFSVELGATIGPLGAGGPAGAAFTWGVGLELPLVLPTSWPGHGLHLRLAGRRARARAGDQAAPPGGVDDWTLLAGLVVRAAVDAGIAGDRPGAPP